MKGIISLRALLRLVLPLVMVAGAMRAEDEAALKQRVQARSQSVVELLSKGVAIEGSDGLLKPVGQLEAQQSRLIQEENQDRQAIFSLISAKSKVPADDVASLYSKLARAKWPPQAASSAGYGPCSLTPARPDDVSRLLQYLKQGINFAGQKKFDLALAEFKPALTIDHNFLGLNQNVGSAELALKQYPEAESALQAEIKLVGCLAGMNDNDLASFGYFLEVDAKDPAGRKAAQAAGLRAELPKVKAATYYNLACLYSLQRKQDAGLESLKSAVQSGFNDRKVLTSDPDLAYLRQAAGYQQILSGASK